MESNIWPRRTVLLADQGDQDGASWMDDSMVAQVVAIVTDGSRNRLEQPYILGDGDNIKVLALVPLGDDGIASGHTLYLVVTHRRPYQKCALGLEIVSFPHQRGGVGVASLMDTWITPDGAARRLDALVERLRGIPGLAANSNR